MVLCNICKTQFRCINGEYICQEGHISHTKVEIADDLHLSSQSKKRKKTTNSKQIFSKYDISYRKLLLYGLIHKKLIEFLSFKSQKYFDFFCNFFEGDRNEIKKSKLFNGPFIILLAYLGKRKEIEKAKKTFLFVNFIRLLQNFNLKEEVKNFKHIVGLQEYSNKKIGFWTKSFTFIEKIEMFKILGRSCYPINEEHNEIYKDFYIPHPLIEQTKLFIRQDFDFSIDYLLKYLDEICNIFAITKPNDLEYFFEKFVHLRNYLDNLFVPEDEVCYFLYLYNNHAPLIIDYEKAYKNLHALVFDLNFNACTSSFPDSKHLSCLCTILMWTSLRVFKLEIQNVIRDINFGSTTFFGTPKEFKFQLKKKVRFEAYISYISRLKEALMNKINYKTKRKYIEDDRI